MKKNSTNNSRKITNTNKHMSWVICMLLTLVAGMQSVTAQTSCVVSGVTITSTGTGALQPYVAPTGTNGGCPTASYTGNGAWTSGAVGGIITYTFTPAVTSATVRYTAVNTAFSPSSPDIGTISVNGGGTATISNPCGVTVSGLTITGSSATNSYVDASITVASTLPFTTLRITNATGSAGNGWIQGNPCSFVINPVICNAGTTAPTLSATTINNVCPATTVNLTTITASNLPASTTLTWHTATPATTANKIATPSSVAAGTYYAAFFDATNNCYSGTGGNGSATTEVTATVNSCASATTCTVSGITITSTGTIPNAGSYGAPNPNNGGCPPSPYTGSSDWTGVGVGGFITYNFSSPVSSVTVTYNLFNGGFAKDIGLISVNGGGTVTLSNPCGVSISGLTISGTFANFGDPSITVTSTLPFTTLTITNTVSTNGWFNGNPCDFTFPGICNAGTTAPTLSATTKANVCPATTVDLTTITASNLPASTTLTWHTATPATTANKIATPSAVAAGTYYAAFFDATNNCYSGTSGNGSATTVVTATVNACCTAGTSVPTLSATTISNACPTTTVNLTTITASNLPGGNTLTWHTGTPATTVNKITTPAAVGAGTYYAAFFDATNNCYSGIGGNGSATTVVTATTTTCAALTANNPTTQTVPGGQVYTGNAGTELAPTGGTGPYTYSNGSSDPACINPGGATALPPASNLTVTNSTTGAYTYTAPTAAGTYFFCIKVCDSTTPTPNCVVKTYTVVVPCAAGSNPPVLIKN